MQTQARVGSRDLVFLSRERKGGFLQQNEPEIVFSNKDVVLLNKAVGMDSEHALGEGFYPIYREKFTEIL